MDYADCYTVIGGAACDILMSEEDLSFRATKDIDMILLLEDRYQEFAKVFWEYIKEGGYRCGWRNSKDVHLLIPNRGIRFRSNFFLVFRITI